MAIERTFSIIKPDATRRNLTGAINAAIEKAGLRIVAQKRVRWPRAQAEKFYEEHKGRPFYDELCTFMTSAPIVVQVLEGENAIKLYRDTMGATDPKEAADGTDPQAVCGFQGRELHARLRQRRQRRPRDRAQLQARGNRRITAFLAVVLNHSSASSDSRREYTRELETGTCTFLRRSAQALALRSSFCGVCNRPRTPSAMSRTQPARCTAFSGAGRGAARPTSARSIWSTIRARPQPP